MTLVRLSLIAILVGILTGEPTSAQTTFHVSPSGSNSGGCGSTGSPCADIQQAVDNASDGDTVKVAAGTYTYNAALGGCPTVAKAVVCLRREIELTVLGGFQPPNWTTSNPAVHESTIDGQGLWRGVRVSDPEPGDAQETQFTMDGFTIRNGKSDPDVAIPGLPRVSFGGGLDSVHARVLLSRLRLIDNQSIGLNTADDQGGWGLGGGMSLREALPGSTLSESDFEGNLAQGGTGTNAGGYGIGGGLLTSGANAGLELLVDNVTFVDNTARGGDTAGGGVAAGNDRGDGQGGGVAFQGGSTVTATGLVAHDNAVVGGDANSSTGSAGGGFGGGVFAENATVSLADFDLRRNTATGGQAFDGWLGVGAGILSTNSDVEMERGQIIDNHSFGGNASGGDLGAPGGGGGYHEGLGVQSTIDVTNVIVAANSVNKGSGGSNIGGGGGGFFFSGVVANLEHVTLADNEIESGLNGGAIVALGFVGAADINIDYSVISDHSVPATARAVHADSNSANVTIDFIRPLFAGNAQDTNDGEGNGVFSYSGGTLMETSVDYAAPGSPAFDYHLDPSSPAIDEGGASAQLEDFEGQPRSTPDLGGDELGDFTPIFSDGFESGDLSKWD